MTLAGLAWFGANLTCIKPDLRWLELIWSLLGSPLGNMCWLWYYLVWLDVDLVWIGSCLKESLRAGMKHDHVYIYIYAYVYVYVYVRMYTYMCIYTYIYIYIYVTIIRLRTYVGCVRTRMLCTHTMSILYYANIVLYSRRLTKANRMKLKQGEDNDDMIWRFDENTTGDGEYIVTLTTFNIRLEMTSCSIWLGFEELRCNILWGHICKSCRLWECGQCTWQTNFLLKQYRAEVNETKSYTNGMLITKCLELACRSCSFW